MSLGDVFRRAAGDMLADETDRLRFLRAARTLLLLDIDISGRKKTKIFNNEADTPENEAELRTALIEAVKRAAADAKALNPSAPDVAVMRRALAAYFVGKSLRPIQHRLPLMGATILLYELAYDAQRARLKAQGKMHRDRQLTERAKAELNHKKQIQLKAEQVRRSNPHLSRERVARAVIKRIGKDWPTGRSKEPHALVQYARRNCIRL